MNNQLHTMKVRSVLRAKDRKLRVCVEIVTRTSAINAMLNCIAEVNANAILLRKLSIKVGHMRMSSLKEAKHSTQVFQQLQLWVKVRVCLSDRRTRS